MMKKDLTKEEREKWYSKYFDLEVKKPTPEEYAMLDHPLNLDEVLPIEQAANFVIGGEAFIGTPNGYCILPDGRSYTANCKFIPGVSVEMCQWWFQWLNIRPSGIDPVHGNLKYKIWCPLDHWDHGYQIDGKPESGTRICESFDLGAGDEPQYFRGKGGFPEAYGVTEAMLQKARDEGRFVGFGWSFDDEGNPTGVGVNQFRNVPGGCEWSARGWGGYTFEDKKLVKIKDFKPRSAESCRNEMLHNFTEEAHLPKILIPLYEYYKDRPINEE